MYLIEISLEHSLFIEYTDIIERLLWAGLMPVQGHGETAQKTVLCSCKMANAMEGITFPWKSICKFD